MKKRILLAAILVFTACSKHPTEAAKLPAWRRPHGMTREQAQAKVDEYNRTVRGPCARAFVKKREDGNGWMPVYSYGCKADPDKVQMLVVK